MTSQNGFKSHILNLLADERAKKAAIEASIKNQLEEIEANITALTRTLRLYEGSNSSTPIEHTRFPVSPAEVRAHTHTHQDALEYIATKLGGTLNYRDARDIIIAAGMTNAKGRNLGSHLHKYMTDSDDWERIAPGTFRFLKAKPALFDKTN